MQNFKRNDSASIKKEVDMIQKSDLYGRDSKLTELLHSFYVPCSLFNVLSDAMSKNEYVFLSKKLLNDHNGWVVSIKRISKLEKVKIKLIMQIVKYLENISNYLKQKHLYVR